LRIDAVAGCAGGSSRTDMAWGLHRFANTDRQRFFKAMGAILQQATRSSRLPGEGRGTACKLRDSLHCCLPPDLEP